MSDMEDFIDVKVTRRGREVAGRLLQVAGDDQSRRTQFGAHRSFSMGYDDLAYPSLRRAANIEAFWTCVKLFGLLQNCSSKRDVPTSPFEAHGQQELPLAGTHSPFVPVPRRARGHAKCLLRPQRGCAMKPKLGTFVTALFRATLTFRPTVIIAAIRTLLAVVTVIRNPARRFSRGPS